MAAIFAGMLASAYHEVGKGRYAAFTTYYRAAQAVRHGESPYGAPGGGNGGYAYVYPPFYAFCCQPLTHLSIVGAARVMLAVNVTFIVASILLASAAMARRLGVRGGRGGVVTVATVVTVLTVVQCHKELSGLQTGAILALSFSAALYWCDRRPLLAGLALAVGISVKYVPVVAIPYLLLRGRWGAAWAAVGFSVAFALLPATSLGWSTNLRFLTAASGGLSRVAGDPSSAGAAQVHGLTDPLNVSIPSAVARLAGHAGWTRRGAAVLAAAIAAAWLGVVARGYRRAGVPLVDWPPAAGQDLWPFEETFALEWAGLVVFILAFSPNTQLVQAIVPAAALAALLTRVASDGGGRGAGAFAGACVMTAAALLLPMAATGHRFTEVWNRAAAPCWLMLAAFGVAWPLAVDQVARGAVRSLPETGSEQPPTGA